MNTAIAISLFGVCIYLTAKLGFFQDRQERRRAMMQHEHNRNLGSTEVAKTDSDY